MKQRHSRWQTIALAFAALVTVTLIGGTGYLAWFLFDDHVGPDIAFDAHQWKTAVHDTDQTRLRMKNDLIRKHPLVGMTKRDVMTLLGPPSDPAYASSRCIVYWLGPEPGWIGIDSAWLEIEFFADRVVDVRVKTD